ncbi:MAG TPA: hypothetical protein VF168_10500 [Trueperaceae bacterium]
MNLLDQAQYGDRRHTRILSSSAEAKLVLFSLANGQEVKGRGEPRVHMIALEGRGSLWAGENRIDAKAGTMIQAEPGEAHGAAAADGNFLVLGIITPGS